MDRITRILKFETFMNEDSSFENHDSLNEAINILKKDFFQKVHSRMYSETQKFVFGKTGLSSAEIESKNNLFETIFDNIWVSIEKITNPNNGYLTKSKVYDFKFEGLQNFINHEMLKPLFTDFQESDNLNILNDINKVKSLISNGRLRSTLGVDYRLLGLEDQSIINLVDDQFNKRPKMKTDLYTAITTQKSDWKFNPNLGVNSGQLDSIQGFRDIKEKYKFNGENFGFYFVNLIVNSVYEEYITIVAESISKSYKSAKVTSQTSQVAQSTQPVASPGATQPKSSVSRSGGSRSAGASTVSAPSSKVNHADLFGL